MNDPINQLVPQEDDAIQSRTFKTVDNANRLAGWSGRGEQQNIDGSYNKSYKALTFNGNHVEFVFNLSENDYINGFGSYVAFSLECDLEMVGSAFELSRGPLSLFDSIELVSSDNVLIDSCADPEMVEFLTSVSYSNKDDPRGADACFSAQGMTDGPFGRRYVLPLSKLLMFFATNKLLPPFVLNRCTLRLRLKTNFADCLSMEPRVLGYPAPGTIQFLDPRRISFISAEQRSYVFETQMDMRGIVRNILENRNPRLDDPPSGGYEDHLALITVAEQDINISLRNVTLVLDAYSLTREARMRSQALYAAKGFTVGFMTHDVFTHSLTADSTEIGVPRSVGALQRVMLKVVTKPDSDSVNAEYGHHFPRLRRIRNAITNRGVETLSSATSKWALKSAQIRIGNLLYPDRPVTNQTEALFQYMHAFGGLGLRSTGNLTGDELPYTFNSLDTVAFSVAADKRISYATSGPAASAFGPDTRGYGAAQTTFDRELTVRVSVEPILNYAVEGVYIPIHTPLVPPETVMPPEHFFAVPGAPCTRKLLVVSELWVEAEFSINGTVVFK